MYTLRQVSAITGYKMRTIRGWIHDNKILATKGKKGIWFIEEAVVAELVKKRMKYDNEN